MDETIEDLKAKIAMYEQYGSIGLYYELNRFINNTVKIMRNTSLEGLLVGSKEDDPKKFERMMALIKNAKEHASDMIEMKDKLGLSGDEEKDKRKPFITTVAQVRN